jgi:DMSO/TMAO reductase YedYZ molybdopterin-dependent catalytic subunit
VASEPGGGLYAGLVGAGAARLVALLARPPATPAGMRLAAPAQTLAHPPPGAAFGDVRGLTRLFTPNRSFYRIDTALVVPSVDLDRWRLRVRGMVDRPFELTYAELSSMPQVEADITLSCVSNEIGGSLVGNARWQGVPLADVLARAGVQPGATQLVGRSVDGWTGGFPTELATDGRAALVALGMNGEPLPLAHGFPARLVVPGLFGYVSATKWLRDIELTTWEGFDGYWVPRGWDKLGPINVQSRIDVPRHNQRLPVGRRAVAGVAWAPTRGIARVEVSIDGGPWNEATLADELSTDTWRQWRYAWNATPGTHRIAVRATDGAGEIQVAERRRPRPAGATGHHTVVVKVA